MGTKGLDELLAASRDPYRLALQLGTDRYENLVRSKANWMRFAWLLSAIIVFMVVALAWMGTRPREVPYTALVDRLGTVLAVGVADNTYKVDPERVLYGQIKDFFENARTVTSDSKYQRKLIDAVYARVAAQSPAKTFLDQFYTKNNPFTIMATSTRQVSDVTLLQESPTTWRGEWKENVYSRNGDLVSSETYRGLVNFDRRLPESKEEVSANPIGLWIKQVSWEKVQ